MWCPAACRSQGHRSVGVEQTEGVMMAWQHPWIVLRVNDRCSHHLRPPPPFRSGCASPPPSLSLRSFAQEIEPFAKHEKDRFVISARLRWHTHLLLSPALKDRATSRSPLRDFQHGLRELGRARGRRRRRVALRSRARLRRRGRGRRVCSRLWSGSRRTCRGSKSA